MAQLGFTFYPKDWWTSDSFYALSPFERYIYLELLFMMYDNGGCIKNNKAMAERRLLTTIKDDVWVKISDLMVKEGDQLTHRSVNKRLSKAIASRENGKKGGAPKGNANARKTTQTTQENNLKPEDEKQPKNNLKTTKTTGCFENGAQVDFANYCKSEEKQPKQPKKTTQNNPPYKREREIEIEIEKEKENVSPPPPVSPESFLEGIKHMDLQSCAKAYFCSKRYERAVELLCMGQGLTVNGLKNLALQFNEHCTFQGKISRTLDEWASHFSYWVKDPKRLESQQKSVPDETAEWKRKLQAHKNKFAGG